MSFLVGQGVLTTSYTQKRHGSFFLHHSKLELSPLVDKATLAYLWFTLVKTKKWH